MGKSMTGYQSKKAAALDEDGMYLVHHTKRKNDDDDSQMYIAEYEAALQKDYQRGYDAGKAAQPEQEPVAWMWDVNNGGGYTTRNVGLYKTDIPFAKHTPLYTAPPQPTWVDLTDEQIFALFDSHNVYGSKWLEFARAVLAKSKEKNA
jgi:hypothetical protein